MPAVRASAVVQHFGDVRDAPGPLADPQRHVVVEGQRELGPDPSRLVERAVRRNTARRPVYGYAKRRSGDQSGFSRGPDGEPSPAQLVLVGVDEVDVVTGGREHLLDAVGGEAVAGVDPGHELGARARQRRRRARRPGRPSRPAPEP